MTDVEYQGEVNQENGEPSWASDSSGGLPDLAKQILAYVEASPGCVVHELAMMYQVVPETARKYVNLLVERRLIDAKTEDGRMVLTPRRTPHSPQKPGKLVTKQDGLIRACDLFCGFGGFSSGMAKAFEELGANPAEHVDLVAINHWDKAIEYHRKNHPWARHCQEAIEHAQPLELFPDGYLDLLVLSPSCTHHSSARGGKPVDDKMRTHCWAAVRWARDLDIDTIIVENVPDFVKLSPQHYVDCKNCKERCGRCKGSGKTKAGKACKSCDGSGNCDRCNNNGRYLKATNDGSWYRAWVREMKRLGYTYDYRFLNAADYGDATSRKRYFGVFRKGDQVIKWPKQTHSANGEVPGTKPHRAAREIIDWNLIGESIFTREANCSTCKGKGYTSKGRGKQRVKTDCNPCDATGKVPDRLAWKTMLRIAMGVHRYNGIDIRPVLAAMYPKEAAKGMPEFKDDHIGIQAAPYLVQFQGTSDAHSVETVLPGFTAGGGKLAVAEPHITEYYGNSTPASVDAPMNTATGKARHGVVEPDAAHLLDTYDGSHDFNHTRVKDVNNPVPTLTGSGRWGITQPTIVRSGGRESHPTGMEQPLNNIETREHYAVARPEAFTLGQQGGAEMHPDSDPVPTVAGKGAIRKIDTYILPPNGIQGELDSNAMRDINEPMQTITAGRGGGHVVKTQPMIHNFSHGQHIKDADDPLPTICTERGGSFSVVDPIIVGNGGPQGSAEPQPVDKPVGSLTTENHRQVVEPVVLPNPRNKGIPRPRSVEEPLHTLTAHGARQTGLAQPAAFLYPNHGERPDQGPRTHSVDEPYPTITGSCNPRVVMPVIHTKDGAVVYDIRMRMMAPHELAAAMGFDDDYVLPESTTVAIKQIGNAVAVGQAKALIKSVLDPQKHGLDAWL